MANRKLGRTADARMAIIKNLASELFWNGRIETTYERAKEVQAYAERLLTAAINSYEDVVKVKKTVKTTDGKSVEVEFVNDGSKKLAVRRKLMGSLRDLQESKNDGESKSAYNERTKDAKHPLIEKIFREYAPFYAKRAESLGQKGGYTRVLRNGERRGDNADKAILEFVKNTTKESK
jgi:large subunit ribosomal protein L17